MQVGRCFTKEKLRQQNDSNVAIVSAVDLSHVAPSVRLIAIIIYTSIEVFIGRFLHTINFRDHTTRRPQYFANTFKPP